MSTLNLTQTTTDTKIIITKATLKMVREWENGRAAKRGRLNRLIKNTKREKRRNNRKPGHSMPFWVRVMMTKLDDWWSDSSLQIYCLDRSSSDTALKTRDAVILFLSESFSLKKKDKEKGWMKIQSC